MSRWNWSPATARDLQLVNMQRNVPWDQSKGFDTFAPLGPYLATADEVPDPHNLELRLEVDGELRQFTVGGVGTLINQVRLSAVQY